MRGSLAAQLRLGFAAVLVLVLGVSGATWWIALDYGYQINFAYRTHLHTAVQLADANSALWQLRYAIPEFMIGSAAEQQRILAEQEQWYAMTEVGLAVYANTAPDAEERRSLTSLRSAYQRYKQARSKFFELWAAGEKDEAIAWSALTTTPFGAETMRAFASQIALQHSLDLREQAEAEQKVRVALGLVTAISMALLAMLVIGYAYAARMLRPIRALRAQAQRVVREQLGEIIEESTSGNEVAALVESFEFMSDRLRAHAESLRQSRERLDFLLTATPAVIWSSEAGGAFDRTYVSPNVRALLGYDAAEFTASPGFWAGHIHPDDRERVLAGAASAQEAAPVHEYRFCHKDGSWRWLRAEMQVIRDASGAAKELIGYWIDITARVRADEEHEQIRERLQSALEGAQLAVWDADEAGNIWLSQEWAELLGQPGSVTWTTLKDLIALAEPKDRERVRNTVIALAKGESSEFSEEYPVRSATGKLLWLQWQGRVTQRTAEGRAARMSGTVGDITVRKQTEERLQLLADRLALANSAKTYFLASVTHELRTPLNSVIGFAGLLKDEVPGPLNAKQAAFAADILASGERLLALVEGILEMSRLDAAGAALEREPVEIGAALEERVAAHRKAAEARRVSIALEVAADIGSAELDSKSLRRMLDALLDNAIKFNRVGGQVTVSARREGDWLGIAVADTGIGMAREDLEKLFQPLVQLDAGLGRRHGGIGLGLTLARSLAQAQEGTIEVTSEPGQGSTFTLRLPTGETS